MEKNKFETDDLYGVFCNDGVFKVYYHGIIEDTVQCLFKGRVARNTIIKEEIKLFSPLVAYDPNDSVKVKSQEWMNGQIFTNNDKYYRAIKLDTIINKILCNNYAIENEESIKKLEDTINKRLQESIIWYRDIWNNILEEERASLHTRKLKQE